MYSVIKELHPTFDQLKLKSIKIAEISIGTHFVLTNGTFLGNSARCNNKLPDMSCFYCIININSSLYMDYINRDLRAISNVKWIYKKHTYSRPDSRLL